MNDSIDRVLDAALRRALPGPELPAGFHARLSAALERAGRVDIVSARDALEREYRAQLAELRQGYVRLRWKTLGTLIGVAFTAGVGLTLAMPWLQANLGENAVWAAPVLAVIFALGAGWYVWQRFGSVGAAAGLR